MRDLTVLILTFNEGENIERTLSVLAWVPQIIIIDSFSTDDTCECALRFPQVEIVQRHFDTHTQQWNFGLGQVRSPWVLSLDADYVIGPELHLEIDRLAPDDAVNAYSAEFRYLIFGHPLRHTVYPPRTVLFRKDQARYEEDGHTQLLRVSGRVLPLQGKIDHDDRKPLSRWIVAQDRYLTIEALHLISTPNDQLNRQDRLRKRIYFAPFVLFFYLLFGRGLILDGWPGWYYVAQRTIAEMLLSLRLLTEREGLENGQKRSGPIS